MVQLLRGFADRVGTAALVDRFGTTSWEQLDRRVNQLVHAFRDAGLEPGDRVAVLSSNRREVFEAVLAGSHTGVLTVPVNWHFTGDEVAYVLADSGARAFLIDTAFGGVAAAAVARLGSSPLTLLAAWGQAPVPGFRDYEELLSFSDAAEPADQVLGTVMFYTSGTTGRPKGVRSTAFRVGLPPEVLSATAAAVTSLGIPQTGRTLLCGPHYHSAQWVLAFMPLLTGSTVVIQERFDAAQTLEYIDEYAITNVNLVPTHFVRLLRVDDELRRAFRGRSLEVALHGGAPCSPDVKRQMIEWWGPKIVEYYGATEGGLITKLTSEEWLEKPGSVGRVLPTCEVRIVADDGSDAPPGRDGVIHVRSLIGQDFEYLNDSAKTAEAHPLDGFFTLGDIGHFDADGYLYLSDRAIDMIISGGVNIYPAEVEAVLITHPAVHDCAVFGVPNAEYGEEVKAAVQLDAGYAWTAALEGELESLLRSRIAGYKVPRSWDVVDDLPRNAAGKLAKAALRAPYWNGANRKI